MLKLVDILETVAWILNTDEDNIVSVQYNKDQGGGMHMFIMRESSIYLGKNYVNHRLTLPDGKLVLTKNIYLKYTEVKVREV